MRIGPVILIALAGLGACSPKVASRPVTVAAAEAVCDPITTERLTTVCFVTLTAQSADTLTGVASPAGIRAEPQQYQLENGMLVPYRLAGVPLAANQPMRLHRDGPYLRLFGVTQPLRTGDTVDLTLSFATSGPLSVKARVTEPPAA